MLTSARFLLLCAGAYLAAAPASAEKKYGPGVSDTEIKIGQTMPYSGPSSIWSMVGRTEGAYFDDVNAAGGINGRKVTWISLDDGYSPPKAVEQIRRLVEQDQVLAIMGSLGTATNMAVQRYLNGKKVPQALIATGTSHWNDPKNFPWTVPMLPLYSTEGAAYAKYLLETKPGAKIAVLYQNDDLGKDYLVGLNDGLGAKAATMIVARQSYEVTDASIDSQIVALQGSGADTFVDIANGKFTAQAIRKVFDLGWRPLHIITQLSSSPATVLKPAGVDKSVGLITATYAKAPGDPTWAKDPSWVAYLAFMKHHFPDADPNDNYAWSGWSNAHVFADVLKSCGDDLTRENLMHVVTHLSGVAAPSFLPGVTIELSPTDYRPIKKMQFERFDGTNWVLFGGLVE
ncbi:MAG: Amino acid/amide transporter substrate-binding protein family [Rhodospirillales bacterium]|nr:Amino acid/amide transporter substrate-binding protein family [Rhodospirillales bacterium]